MIPAGCRAVDAPPVEHDAAARGVTDGQAVDEGLGLGRVDPLALREALRQPDQVFNEWL
jgi:hypothetical protein